MKPVPEEYDNVVEIDESRLDRECQRQPKLYMQYGLALATAKKQYAEAKANFDLVKATLELEVRSSPSTYHTGKITEGVVESVVIAQKRYREAQTMLIQAKYKQDQLQVAVDALDHKKSSLESMIRLEVNNLHSEPKLDGDMRGANEEMRKRTARKPLNRRV